jgi:glucose/arabinose dehydrogenase/mono/diheme cytochrome c family protein
MDRIRKPQLRPSRGQYSSFTDHITKHRSGLAAAVAAALSLWAGAVAAAEEPAATAQACPGDNGGITLPPGFCATVFADKIGHVRHMVIAPNGVLYVNTWSGGYYTDNNNPAGGFLVALQDTTGNGKADKIVRFGPGVESGNAGGTGIALYNGALYAETNDKIVRYKLPSEGIAPTGNPEVIVSGFPLTGDHPMHPFKIDAQGNMYTGMGSATNACQEKNRMLGSKGIDPCTELETRAGVWLFDANRTGQKFSPAERFATGLRNSEGFGFDSKGRMFATQHGRDQLRENWPKLYTAEQGANEPAEELVQLERGGDYGWPYCYYDLTQQKLLLAPEYGGDGKKVGRCADKRAPIAAFPAHWAPDDLALYDGSQFPSAYREGAFIAFHGSWNRAPFPQAGYNVVFQPLADGKASGKYVVFANGFAGGNFDPGAAAHRPTGLAIARDGSLYISDDAHGRIWRVTYHGPATAEIQAAPAPTTATAAAGGTALPPEGIHPEAGREAAGLPTPPGATAAEVLLGSRIYHGEEPDVFAPCSGCHGTNAAGTNLAPPLSGGKWLWGDGSLPSLTNIITHGVPNPKKFGTPMPPMGGGELTPAQVSALAAYIWSINHRS